MNRIFIYTIVLIAFLSEPAFSAGPDYEAQLQHQMVRISKGLEDYAKTKNEVRLQFQCLSTSEGSAKSLVEHHKLNHAEVEQGQWLSYKFKVKLNYKLNLSEIDIQQWIRTRFFIGIAYNCDMDGIYVLSEGSL